MSKISNKDSDSSDVDNDGLDPVDDEILSFKVNTLQNTVLYCTGVYKARS